MCIYDLKSLVYKEQFDGVKFILEGSSEKTLLWSFTMLIIFMSGV